MRCPLIFPQDLVLGNSWQLHGVLALAVTGL